MDMTETEKAVHEEMLSMSNIIEVKSVGQMEIIEPNFREARKEFAKKLLESLTGAEEERYKEFTKRNYKYIWEVLSDSEIKLICWAYDVLAEEDQE